MKNKSSILLTFFLLLASNGHSAAKSKEKLKPKKKSRSSTTKINLSLDTKHHSNLDELTLNENIGSDAIVNTLKLKVKSNFKLPAKFKLSSKTSLEIQQYDIKKVYKEVDLTEHGKISNNFKKVSLSQDFSLKRKISKKVIATSVLGFEKSQGHNITQEFTETDSNYHAIAEDFLKSSLSLGLKMRLSKKSRTILQYRFSDFQHSNQYTYDESQGDNDKRIRTFGAFHSMPLTQTLKISLAAQQDQVEFKNRLALTEQGFFKTSGSAKALTYNDQAITIGLNYKGIINLTYKTTTRDDIIDQGDSFRSDESKLALKYAYKAFSLSLSESITRKSFTKQLARNQKDKRLDTSATAKLALAVKLDKVSLSLLLEDSKTLSNNVYGDLEGQIVGLGLKKQF